MVMTLALRIADGTFKYEIVAGSVFKRYLPDVNVLLKEWGHGDLIPDEED